MSYGMTEGQAREQAAVLQARATAQAAARGDRRVTTYTAKPYGLGMWGVAQRRPVRDYGWESSFVWCGSLLEWGRE